MNQDQVNKITAAILANLNDRKGFDDWWDGIDSDIQVEIFDSIKQIVERFDTDQPPALTTYEEFFTRAQLEDSDEE